MQVHTKIGSVDTGPYALMTFQYFEKFRFIFVAKSSLFCEEKKEHFWYLEHLQLQTVHNKCEIQLIKHDPAKLTVHFHPPIILREISNRIIIMVN